jgi:RNA polymerase sigma-70 factor (ECF subfamily)
LREKLSEFCAREYPRLVGAVVLYSGDRENAEDIAQEALVRAWLHWGTLRDPAAAGAWAHRVAMNLAVSHFRRRQRDERLQDALSANQVPLPAATSEALLIRGALLKLPPRQRRAVILRYYLQYTAPEIGENMGCSEGAVRQLIHRAVSELRILIPTREMEATLDV